MTYPKKGLTERQWRYYSKYKKDIGLSSKAHGLLVELHYSFENYLGFKQPDVQRFLQQSEVVHIGGRPFKTMNKHQTFLYLNLHGAVHQYRRLFWLRDIAQALSKWELDHERILEDASNLGVERMIGLSVNLAGELFNVDLAEGLLQLPGR